LYYIYLYIIITDINFYLILFYYFNSFLTTIIKITNLLCIYLLIELIIGKTIFKKLKNCNIKIYIYIILLLIINNIIINVIYVIILIT